MRTEPTYKWQLSVGDEPATGVLYDSVDAAWAGLSGYAARFNAASKGVVVVSYTNLHQGNQFIYNGVPSTYLADGSFSYPKEQPPRVENFHNVLVISAYPLCSKEGWGGPFTQPVSGGVTIWCERSYSTPEPTKSSCQIELGDPIYSDQGAKVQPTVDYRSADGLLEFTRTYRNDITTESSAVSHSGIFDGTFNGRSYGQCLSLPWQYTYKNETRSGTACFSFIGTGTQDAQLWTADGRVIPFTQTGGKFVPAAHINDTVTRSTDSSGKPTWTARRENNTLETYGASGQISARVRADGKTVSYQYSTPDTPRSIAPYPGLLITQTDAFGRTLNFKYDDMGRLAVLVDPAGKETRYTYDITSPGCASSRCDRVDTVTYPDGFALKYGWNEAGQTSGASLPDALTSLTELWPDSSEGGARQVRYSTSDYTAAGAALSTSLAGGADKYSLKTNADGSVTITDPLGTAYTQEFTTLLGMKYLTKSSQPPGSGCPAASSTASYDANGNLKQRDDLDGHRTCYGYDTTRNLETVRVEGLGATANCNSLVLDGAVLPTGARKISTQWHPAWRMPTKVAEPGRITTYAYNDNGASCALGAPLLPDGKQPAVLCSKTLQATTDTTGAKAFTATSDSAVPARQWSYTYNAQGQVLTATGPLAGDVTRYAYYDTTTADHTRGDLQSITPPLLPAQRFTRYDPHGQLLQSIDANGVITDYQYDSRQRLKQATTEGKITRYDYWPTGLLRQATAPDSSYVRYVYDDAHRLTQVFDDSGNSITYTLDNIGNRLKEETKDPQGTLQRQLSRTPDVLGRIQQVTGRE